MHCDGTAARRIVDEKAPNNKILVESSTSDNRLTLNRIDLSSEQHEGNDVHSHSNRWHSRHYISHHSERRYCGKHIYAWRCRFIRWLQWGRYQQYDHEIQRLHHLHGIQEDTWRGALVREQCGIVVFVIESIAQANRSPWLAGIWNHLFSFPPSLKNNLFARWNCQHPFTIHFYFRRLLASHTHAMNKILFFTHA